MGAGDSSLPSLPQRAPMVSTYAHSYPQFLGGEIGESLEMNDLERKVRVCCENLEYHDLLL